MRTISRDDSLRHNRHDAVTYTGDLFLNRIWIALKIMGLV